MTLRWVAVLMLTAVAVTGAVSAPFAGHRLSMSRPAATTTALISPTSTFAPTGSEASRLVNVDFFNPRSGYGAFARGSTSACELEVATTSDGGAKFEQPVEVTSCDTLGYKPSLAFDNHGDGFLYSSTADLLYVTHDGGSTWSPAVEKGKVLSVGTLGYSVWMLTVECPKTSPPIGTTARCRLSVRESADGGRSWRTSASQPRVASRFPAASAGGGSLVRLSRSAAYVEGGPNGYGDGKPSTVPLWYTDDGGAVWSLHDIPCGIGSSGAVSLSAAPTGTLYAVCGGEPGAGNQVKSVVVSGDGGRTWSHPGACTAVVDDWCATRGILGGYLGQIQAVSSTTAFMFGPRSSIRVTTNGGETWRDVGTYSTLISNVIFFSRSSGIACGLSPQEIPTVWHTDDGGTSWTSVTPVVQRS